MNALLIGCDYEGTSSELRGCSRDVVDTREYLVEKGYITTVLCDDESVKNVVCKPEYKNFIEHVEKFCSLESSKFFFHYSGHGSHTKDNSGDEKDNKDELIVCTDHVFVSDDILNKLFNKLNSVGIFLIDACHSGTILDFKYTYDFITGEHQENNNDNNFDAILISGCKDNQTSADAYLNGTYRGAMTTSFLHVLKNYGIDITLKEFVNEMRKYLINKKFSQIPQLSYTRSESYKRKMSDFIC